MDNPESDTPEDEHAADEPDEEFASLVGTLVADRYQVEALLGEGAMGAVYRAKHIHMQKDVALKVLHRTMSTNQEVVRRFEREAVAAGRIEHPNVAGASDFGRLSDGAFYLVLEYIAGQSLGGLIEDAGKMEPERACRIALQIASALSAAHGEGIVHRDLKPENVMLPAGDHEGDIVKVLDFGMAKMAQTDETNSTKLTMHGAVYGTPAYMAPEQAAGNEVDHRADLYALGLMLYEMVNGGPPFTADQVMALLVKQMTEAPPALSSDVPRKLAKIIMKMLAKDPDDRHQTADEILEELSEFLGIAYTDPRRSALGLSAPQPTPRPPQASVAQVVKQQMAENLERVGPALEKAKKASAPAVASTVTYLKEEMTVKGKSFPRWIPAAAAFGFLAVLLALTLSGGEEADNDDDKPWVSAEQEAETPQEVDASANDPSPPDPELAKVIKAAAAGSEPALYALEQRSDDDRSLTEWMGLAKARLMYKKTEPALEAFESAIEIDESMKTDKRMLGALRYLADDPEHAEEILEFAAEEMGSLGADLLFHVWSKTSAQTPSTKLAKDLLDSSSVKRNYSPALDIAMRLRDVRDDCDRSYKLLPEVEKLGDERVMVVLRKMAKKNGCGNREKDDCYPCMRDDDVLRDATAQAAMRKAPQFRLSRWTWKK